MFLVRLYVLFYLIKYKMHRWMFKHWTQRLKAHSLTQGWRWANHILQEESLVEVDASISDKDSHLSQSFISPPPTALTPCHMLWVTWLLATPPCLFSQRGTSASLSRSLSPSPHEAQQHTKSRLTVSLPRQSKRKQRKVYLGTDCYYWLEKGLRDQLFFIHVGRKEAWVQLCGGE